MPAHEYTPVRPRTSKVVHATSFHTPTETACGLEFRGWLIEPSKVNCVDCQHAVFMDTRPKKPKAKPRKRRRAGA